MTNANVMWAVRVCEFRCEGGAREGCGAAAGHQP